MSAATILIRLFGPPQPERPVSDAAVAGADSMMQAAEASECITRSCRYALNREGLALRCVVGCYAAMKEQTK